MAVGVRTCEDCGSKMPFARARRRRASDGKLVCPGCFGGAPGTRMHGAFQGKPGIDQADFRLTYTYPLEMDPAEAQEMLLQEFPARVDAIGINHVEIVDGRIEASLRVHAHDSGDGETIFHWPGLGAQRWHDPVRLLSDGLHRPGPADALGHAPDDQRPADAGPWHARLPRVARAGCPGERWHLGLHSSRRSGPRLRAA
mgnify:CR=1 FL=1